MVYEAYDYVSQGAQDLKDGVNKTYNDFDQKLEIGKNVEYGYEYLSQGATVIKDGMNKAYEGMDTLEIKKNYDNQLNYIGF